MNGVGKRVQDIVVSATRDIESFPQRERPDSAFEQYAEALREPNNSYRDHSNQTVPTDDELRGRFQYETAVLHVISRALAFDIGLSNSAVTAHLPVHQSDNLYSWYSLPCQLCNDIDTIAADVLDWRFFRQFISDLSADIQCAVGSHGVGEYYTPFSIVRHLIEVSGLTATCITEGNRVIDPACGSGIILLTLRNMRRDKRTRRNVYTDKIIRDIFNSFALEETRSVCVKLDFPQHTPPIRAFIVDWESIFVNLLANAVWALQPVQNREIRVRIREIDGRLNIWFADSGQGISKRTIDHIFEPAFSTKRNQRGDKIGTGMGLAIVEDLVKSYIGNIHVSSPSDLGGAEFHIVVPLPQTPSGGNSNGAR